jgi:hypothetical protein
LHVNRIFTLNLVRRRVNGRKDVLVLQVDVHLAGDGMCAASGFTVEM